MPKAHLEFITSLPFLYETESLVLVHAGLEKSDWEKQRAKLLSRDRSEIRGPAQLFSHLLATTIAHPAPKTLVSGHAVLALRPRVGPRRLFLNCGVDMKGPLVAWISDQNKFIKAT